MTVYDELAQALDKATQVINLDNEDSLTVERDASYRGCYKVRIDWQAGYEGNGLEWMTLKDLYCENIDNVQINKVLAKFREKIFN
ncbi:hypothetical protein [Lactobacillus hominis]|uniref:Uncharacterized protein n=1 Tax=Lactobacillus hominis DSM 23910 = CRBIP 24.179 TaxID=1423758 RepID=I7L9R8_9LACO|nr:hypothetical protein [Lactobacillus hominis]KRM85834.1 hypothetical protein FC41_GL000019 [Lactobacillus hominis DSM 23910 = CRBIP 24.179]MCT3348932.1 hypothetical protein [Lactobacillus hominis]CCI81624.1 Protein of unknown function [Lactobacillus hominis DSM 23910 = CRBIP 24.179]